MNKLRDLSILDVATKLGFTLKGTGLEGRRAVCPYHDDKHPSLHFSRKKNIFKCFVCGAKGDLFKLVMDSENLSFPDACQWLMKKFSIVDLPDVDCHSDHRGGISTKPAVVECIETPKVFKPLDQTFVTKSLSVKSTFCTSLVTTGLLSQQQMLSAADRYHLGISKDGGVVFWLIDDSGIIRNGKIMFYEPNCHRSKSHTPTWVVAKLKSSGSLPSNVDNPHCLFGLHLLNPQTTRSLSLSKGVAVVESEKSAIILSELFPDYLWMASGGKTMLNASLFAPFGDRRIILFPDTDESGETYRFWSQVASEATKLYKSRIHVSNLLELKATAAQKTAKIDIVDFLFPTI